jgi:hypothetical protein
VDAAGDALTVTWCSVRGFDSSSTVTAQASLFPDGVVELRFGEPTTLAEAVVGVSPGGADSHALTPVDLSAATAAGGPGAVGERFAADTSLDAVGVVRRFLSRHSDTYDQILIWTDTRVTGSDAFAFESTVSNDIRGIGVSLFDLSSSYGSAGRLSSLVVMDDLSKYPDDPTVRIPRFPVDNTLSILGQESGHRWGAYLRFRDAAGRSSNLLLGRDEAHWSFFFDSDASVMEGNDIEDLGGGSFRTVAAVQRYGPLDLYAMGLLEESEVPPVFFVDNPANTSETRESDPRIGVTFTGTRREVRIEDIVAAMGSRQPPARQSPRRHAQAFVYVVGRGRTASPAALEKLERIRAAWEPFFAAATEGRMTADTALR